MRCACLALICASSGRQRRASYSTVFFRSMSASSCAAARRASSLSGRNWRTQATVLVDPRGPPHMFPKMSCAGRHTRPAGWFANDTGGPDRGVSWSIGPFPDDAGAAPAPNVNSSVSDTVRPTASYRRGSRRPPFWPNAINTEAVTGRATRSHSYRGPRRSGVVAGYRRYCSAPDSRWETRSGTAHPMAAGQRSFRSPGSA